MVQHDNNLHRYNGQSISIAGREERVEVPYEKRNPYLLDYEEERRRQVRSQRKAGNGSSSSARGREVYVRRSAAGYGEGVNRRSTAGYGEDVNCRSTAGYGEDVNCRSAAGYGEGVNCRSTAGYGEDVKHRSMVGYGEEAGGQSAVGHGENVNRRNAAGCRKTVSSRGRNMTRYNEADEYRNTNTVGDREVSRRQGGDAQIPNRRTQTGYAQSANRRGTAGYAEISNHSAGARRTAAEHRTAAARHTVKYHRRKRLMMQRMAVSIWVMCLLCLAVTLLVRNNRASAADRNPKGDAVVSSAENVPPKQLGTAQPDTVLVQGIPATEFAKHPEWTEDFLTPNEYSRPGDALESVTNIFVHYTANAGTSAAQNRSYFERQKDEHLASVSAHFIIGYEGEIIQCVPLDEIAYAVKSRNFDSISIECCHLERDGSFTQETYDSLITLLKWLLEVYDLESEDILRHYDCGGKKCPLYFTEHPDAWEELKKDVDKL